MIRNHLRPSRSSTPSPEERLRRYRVTLDAATGAHPLIGTTLPSDGLILADEPVLADEAALAGEPRRRPSPRPRLALVGATLAVVAVAGGVALRDGAGPTDQAATIVVPAAGENPAGTVASITDPDLIDPALTDPDRGERCQEGPSATLALAVEGGPDVAAPGFIYSRPASEDDIEAQFISQAIVGPDCLGTLYRPVEARPGDTPGSVVWATRPPGATAEIALGVTVEARGDVAGVVELSGMTGFEVDSGAGAAVLVLHDPLPSGSAYLGVRFKQDGEVWSITGTLDGPTVLTPHPEERGVDRSAPVEWVLFTIADATGVVLDAGGLVL